MTLKGFQVLIADPKKAIFSYSLLMVNISAHTIVIPHGRKEVFIGEINKQSITLFW